jgi:hypothetical protein
MYLFFILIVIELITFNFDFIKTCLCEETLKKKKVVSADKV